ncbi:kinase-like domain-containing protein [Aspergillus karnatakaensis]|uniref:kinase-like domain-containing protein n=1 Tax=Aspergillus karnatakaensis TaxID=1810916 RepID=UPI003CCE124D
MESSTPCSACSWTPERQKHCSYESHVNLLYSAGDRGVWSLGSNLILKDRASRLPTFEVPNIQLVQEKTSIPVPTVVESWQEGTHTMILLKRIPGEPLSKAWPNLSTDEKESIAKQTAEYLQQLRDLQSDQIQALGGRPVYSNFLFHSRRPWVRNGPHAHHHGPLASDDELWAEMERGLGEDILEAVRIRLRSNMPSATPYTFTHGDLTNVNIMVEDGSVTGIIDWETAGYLPVWWEYVCTSVPDSEEDREWKTLLRKYMPDYSAAREFWRDYHYLCRDPGSERAMKFIEAACNQVQP